MHYILGIFGLFLVLFGVMIGLNAFFEAVRFQPNPFTLWASVIGSSITFIGGLALMGLASVVDDLARLGRTAREIAELLQQPLTTKPSPPPPPQRSEPAQDYLAGAMKAREELRERANDEAKRAPRLSAEKAWPHGKPPG